MKDKITFDEFMAIEEKLEIRMGTIITAGFLPKNKKMLILEVDFGTEVRPVVTNIGKDTPPEELIGLQLPFITNLELATINTFESRAMIMVARNAEGKLQVRNIDNGSTLL